MLIEGMTFELSATVNFALCIGLPNLVQDCVLGSIWSI